MRLKVLFYEHLKRFLGKEAKVIIHLLTALEGDDVGDRRDAVFNCCGLAVLFVYVDFYIDQTNRVTDYKVMANFSHEHFSSSQKASELVIGLIRGEVAEVSLNFHDKRASFFIRNSISAEDTIKHIQTNFQDIIALLSQNRCSEGGHLHEKSPISFPYNLLCDYGEQPILDGVTVYIIHTSFSSIPEIRVIQ